MTMDAEQTQIPIEMAIELIEKNMINMKRILF